MATAALFGGVAASATSASAAGYYDDNGGGGGAGGTGGGTGGGDGGRNYQCHAGGLLWDVGRGEYRYDTAYPGCTQSAGWSATGDVVKHPTGMLMFRFYGDMNDPTASWTVSRGNLDYIGNVGDGRGALWTLYATNPWDHNGADPGTPYWVYQGIMRGAGSENASEFHRPWGVTERAGRFVPNRPFASGGTNCANLQTPNNPLVRFFSDPSTTNTQRDAVGRQLKSMFNQIANPNGSPEGLRFTAAAELGLDKHNPFTGDRPNWDAQACSSPVDFVSLTSNRDPQGPGERSQRKVTGVCYIPLERIGQVLRKAGRPNVIAYQGIQKNRPGGGYGERFTRYPDRHNPDNISGTEAWAIGRWRDTMRSWYHGEYGRTGGMNGTRQSLPAQAYQGWGYSRWNVAAAANDLADGARCKFGTQVSWTVVAEPVAPTASVDVAIKNPRVYQAGGVARTQTVTATTGRISCSSGACDTVQLKALDYDLRVEGLAGYTACTNARKVGCDYSAEVTKHRNGKITTGAEVRLQLFNPTLPAQKVRVAIVNLKGEFDYTAEIAGLRLDGTNPVTGDPYGNDSQVGLTEVRTAPLTPTASGAPTALVKNGSNYHFDLPVIGATNIAD